MVMGFPAALVSPLRLPSRIACVGNENNRVVLDICRDHSQLLNQKVLFFPLYSLGMYTGPPALAPNSLRFRKGAFVNESSRARATPNPLFRLVSKSDPWSVLVPLLVVTMMEVGRANLAEELLFSTRNS